jgi:hypothetical protein
MPHPSPAWYVRKLSCRVPHLSQFSQTSFPPAKAIQVALGILLDVRAVPQVICRNHSNIQVNQAASSVLSSSDVLADLLESIERFVNRRLQPETQLLSTPATDEVLVKLYVELISTLARVTEKLNNRRSRECSLSPTCFLDQRHAVKFVKNFFGVKDIKEARQRLDRLVQEEVATTAAQILGGVDRIERKLLGGKRTRSAWTPPLSHPFLFRWRIIN